MNYSYYVLTLTISCKQVERTFLTQSIIRRLHREGSVDSSIVIKSAIIHLHFKQRSLFYTGNITDLQINNNKEAANVYEGSGTRNAVGQESVYKLLLCRGNLMLWPAINLGINQLLL